MGFAFAHHFATYDAAAATRLYREHFRPSAFRRRAYAILAVAAVCADTEAQAEHLASTMDLAFVRRQKGEYLPLASPEEAAAYPYTAQEREKIRGNRARLLVGTRPMLLDRLAPLVAATGADEVMIATGMYDHAARKHSYALLAEAFGLAGASARAAS